MEPPRSSDGTSAPADPGPPIWEDTGLLLFGLLLVVLGVTGIATRKAILVFPGDGRTGSALIWTVTGAGSRIVAAGPVELGTACIGRWRWGEWTCGSPRCAWIGVGLLSVGLLIEGINHLLIWLA
ncbi:hypothetical protein VT84_14280 [Gemmata sp. SH-PL17]|nr:hypothetical protein VT84_14280 [Gemmata sp. SH-PL17]